MGRRLRDDTIVVSDGLYLTSKNGIFQCCFRLNGKDFRRSTKTKDFTKAKLKALQWYQEHQRTADTEDVVERVSFDWLRRSYLQHIRGQGKHNYHDDTIERHFLPFFSKFNDVSKIRRKDILDYLSYRKSSRETCPVPQTINRENTVLRQLFQYAVDREWLASVPRIDNESERLTRRRRRHFTIEEYQTLCYTARKRIEDLRDNHLTKRQLEQRQLLFDYIEILANTGLRVDEAKTLIWRNVDWDNRIIFLEHAGKTKSNRRLFMREDAFCALRRIQERRAAFLAKNNDQINANERVIALANGTAVNSFKKSFNELLSASGFKYKSIHDKHVLTSLRHSYATFRLTTRSGTRTTARALSKQMGTSERMIDRHYGHDLIEDYRNELVD